MKKRTIIIVMGVLVNICVFRTLAQSIEDKEPLVSLGERNNVYSNILKENRQIWVQIPQNSSALTNQSKKYPVIYVLDGEQHFLSICSILNQLAPGSIPEMIVVGIVNSENRTRDLTPTSVEEARGASEWVKESGGGDRFTAFIEKELIPYVNDKYPTENYKTLIGHSFGGLMVVNTLIRHPELFENYIAIDPSLWWDGEVLSKEISKKLSDERYKNKSLFLSMANPLPQDRGKDMNEIIVDDSEETEGLRATYNFSKLVSESTTSNLNFKYRYYEGENHGTVPLISAYDGMKFIFPWYGMNNEFVEVIKDPNATVKEMRNAFNARFSMLSNKLGYEVYPEEDLLNNLGYMFLSRAPKKSFLFFDMAIEYYPESANVYDSLADYHLSKKEYDKALENVTKAYEINAIDYYMDRIDDINKKKKGRITGLN